MCLQALTWLPQEGLAPPRGCSQEQEILGAALSHPYHLEPSRDPVGMRSWEQKVKAEVLGLFVKYNYSNSCLTQRIKVKQMFVLQRRDI